MNTTHAQTWHDLRDQLTDMQLAWLTSFENQYPANLPGGVAGVDRDKITLDYARSHAAQNKIDRERFGNLPTPEDARRIGHWEDDGTGHWSRGFDGQEWTIRIPDAEKGFDTARVDIAGSQHDDGRIERQIYVTADSAVYTADQAIQFAAALVSAAAELNRMNSEAADQLGQDQ